MLKELKKLEVGDRSFEIFELIVLKSEKLPVAYVQKDAAGRHQVKQSYFRVI